MILFLAIAVGLLYAGGIYLMLRRSLVKLVIGLTLLSHGANLLIFTSAGVVRGQPPLIALGAQTLEGSYTDPLPPALILTAIVISFALTAFTLVLAKRAYQQTGVDDTELFRSTET